MTIYTCIEVMQLVFSEKIGSNLSEKSIHFLAISILKISPGRMIYPSYTF